MYLSINNNRAYSMYALMNQGRPVVAGILPKNRGNMYIKSMLDVYAVEHKENDTNTSILDWPSLCGVGSSDVIHDRGKLMKAIKRELYKAGLLTKPGNVICNNGDGSVLYRRSNGDIVTLTNKELGNE